MLVGGGVLVGLAALVAVIVVVIVVSRPASPPSTASGPRSSTTEPTSSTTEPTSSTTEPTTSTTEPTAVLSATSSGDPTIDVHLQAWSNPLADCTTVDAAALEDSGSTYGIDCRHQDSTGSTYSYGWLDFPNARRAAEYLGAVRTNATSVSETTTWNRSGATLGGYLNGVSDGQGLVVWSWYDTNTVGYLYYGTTAAEADTFWSQGGISGR